MYAFLRFFLFLFSAERAHHIATWAIRKQFKIPLLKQCMRSFYSLEHPSLHRELFGIKFSNPIGLAAGFDKDAKFFDEMGDLGFGFVEIGTLTPQAQSGNEKPRLFRLRKDKAIVNRMGFNNEGVKEAVERLKKRSNNKLIIGGNIGKNKWTPNENAVDDYIICFNELFPYVDYFVINVSSPNTPNLRELQEKEPLTNLIASIQKLNKARKDAKPILLKIAPDLSNAQLDDIIDIAKSTALDGIIATNTTISRYGLMSNSNKVKKIGSGGLSGLPLNQRSTDVISYVHNKSNGEIPIIGVGGIHSKKDAIDKLNAGASLIQLYTGFIYEGPGLLKSIKKELIKNG